MAVSQNGYTANNRALIVSYEVPGGRLALRRGPAGELLAAAVRRWHAEVEPLLWPGCWGYAERLVRGGTELSNHASGTAADCSAPRHPLGTQPSANFTPGQIAAARRIITDSGGCLRWGGDYTGRKDGMHLEVIASEAACAAILARWRAPSAPPVAPSGDGSALPTLTYGMKGSQAVKNLQYWLNAFPWNPELPLLPVTGNYLGQTQGVIRRAQAQCGVTGADADGSVVGPRTNRAFWARGYRG